MCMLTNEKIKMVKKRTKDEVFVSPRGKIIFQDSFLKFAISYRHSLSYLRRIVVTILYLSNVKVSWEKMRQKKLIN